ncbi:hypothetical protein [[Mycoplasma] gypis]|uniref:Lipoprotein n=1 Tax=[Mycoplasma] gypis TaxID=92404 RepID=A0ABZ2RMT5_9BACT|nr:hypothetical protein [[Mycoplasma] gypis]MBN0919554.1 hypothetical protein [[Mycoplasma] gypis]
MITPLLAASCNQSTKIVKAKEHSLGESFETYHDKNTETASDKTIESSFDKKIETVNVEAGVLLDYDDIMDYSNSPNKQLFLQYVYTNKDELRKDVAKYLEDTFGKYSKKFIFLLVFNLQQFDN